MGQFGLEMDVPSEVPKSVKSDAFCRRACHEVVTTHTKRADIRWHAAGPSSLVSDSQWIPRHIETARFADCKSVGLRLHRFESYTCHACQAPFRGGLIAFVRAELSTDCHKSRQTLRDRPIEIAAEPVRNTHAAQSGARRVHPPGRCLIV